MSTASTRARYMGDTISTASPQRLVVMLYDRLALDLERGQAALAIGDRTAASSQLQHAQEIILELHASLAIDAWEGGPRLSALYTWLFTELIGAIVAGDADRVGSCRQVVEPLRDAWREALVSLAASPTLTASPV